MQIDWYSSYIRLRLESIVINILEVQIFLGCKLEVHAFYFLKSGFVRSIKKFCIKKDGILLCKKNTNFNERKNYNVPSYFSTQNNKKPINRKSLSEVKHSFSFCLFSCEFLMIEILVWVNRQKKRKWWWWWEEEYKVTFREGKKKINQAIFTFREGGRRNKLIKSSRPCHHFKRHFIKSSFISPTTFHASFTIYPSSDDEETEKHYQVWS